MVKTIDKTMNIRTFHRTIVLRMAGSGLLLSLIFGLMAGWYHHMTTMAQLRERASLFIGSFETQLARTIGSSSVAKDINDLFSTLSSRGDMGQFIAVDVLDDHFQKITSVINPGSPPSKEMIRLKDQLSQTLMQNKATVQRSVLSLKAGYILTASPIQYIGAPQAYMESIFMISPQTLSAARSAIKRSVAGVMIMVLLTTLLLYPAIVTLVHRMGKLALSLMHSNMETLEVLGSAIAKRDSDSETHNYRVTLYAVSLAETVGLEPLAIQGLIKGAFLHDVGKIGVQDSILMKAGRLDDEEFDVIKNQTRFGLDLVNRSQWLDDANQVVAYHHERYDGSGYFAGLKGDEIPMVARIFTIANVFDALTSKRPYKDPLSIEQTLDILCRDKGTHFDPDLVDIFTEIAEGLYRDFAERDDESLKNLLSGVRERYFREHTVIH